MGQRDYFDKKPTLGQNNNALVILFGINAFLFVLLQFIYIVYKIDSTKEVAEQQFLSKTFYWFSVSPQAHELLSKPWTLLVYMFSHFSIIGFISNMLWLWAFGYVLQDLVGNKKLIPVFLYGGFVGGLFFVLSASYIPFISSRIDSTYLFEGSNAAIVAVAIATTTLSPRYRIFQHIGEGFPLWILTVIFVLID
ncbi:MAG: rhomboid family intramembrane serine protease, partial [Bacteroidetes bacterium]|nr:rhomboid family intramembrane serine protease [Bacteroidota bacterium]